MVLDITASVLQHQQQKGRKPKLLTRFQKLKLEDPFHHRASSLAIDMTAAALAILFFILLVLLAVSHVTGSRRQADMGSEA